MNLNINISWFDRVTIKDKAFFAEQVGTMIQSGLPLVQAIDVISQQTKKEKFKKVLEDIHKDIETGKTFSESIKKHPEIFDRIFSNMVMAGEASGKLDEALVELARQINRNNNFISKIKGSLSYPIFVIVVMLGVGIYATVKIIPSLTGVFKEANVTLPWSTKLVMALSDFMIHYWYLLILIIVVAGVVVYYYFKTDNGRWNRDLLLTKEPTKLANKIYMARFSRTLGSLLKNGIPIIEAVDIVSETINNLVIEKSLKNVIQELEKGIPMSQPIKKDKNFPIFISQMMAVGEQTGRVDQILLSLADYFEQDVENNIKNISTLFEPIIIVIIGIGVAFLIFSIILPIYSISQGV